MYKPHFKVEKTYKEYLELFKKSCVELGRTLTGREIRKHEFGLPDDKWFVSKCVNPSITNYNEFLKWLGLEPNKPHRKYTYEIAFEEFAKKGLILLPQEYTSCAIPLNYVCTDHPGIIQHKSLNSLIFGKSVGCPLCLNESLLGSGSNVWKGGISSLNVYLREFIKDWKKESMENCNYKCVITGEKFDAIHHLYSYNKILKETLHELNIPTHPEISKYTFEEIESIKKLLLIKHYEHPLGVCLCKKIHTLFHQLYGKGDNTPEQFEEFKVRYNNGEFINSLESNIRNISRRFNEEQIAEIRENYASHRFTGPQLCLKYSAGKTTISNVLNFKGAYRK